MINLRKLEDMLHTTADVFAAVEKDEINRNTFEYYLRKAFERIETIKGITRSKRSIDWIGTAWKWIAGNPDATDWNQILNSQERLVGNNDHQYIINNKLFDTTNELVKRINRLIHEFDNTISKSDSERVISESLNQLIIIKEDIEEVVRACQLAKTGVINTNLLDLMEVKKIVSEIGSLHYTNEVEAIEYGKPSIISNGTALLYVLSIPKVNAIKYDRILVKAAIIQNRQLDLRYNTVLLSHENIYGIKDSCSTINNTTICALNQLKKLNDDDCLSKILRNVNANCTFLSNKETIIEQVEDDLVFVTNFKGEVYTQKHNISLNGTYLIRYTNETIEIGKQRFINKKITNLQALPPLLANVYEKERKLDVNFLHELHESNIKHINHLKYHLNLSLVSQIIEFLLFALSAAVLIILWRKIFGRIKTPTLNISENVVKESI